MSTDPQQASPRHPVEVLMDEHELILEVLMAVERSSIELEPGAEIDQTFWNDVVDFLVEFADHRHHAKEEGLLFPALVDHGLPAEQGPVFIMKYEHEQARGLTRSLATAVEASDREGIGRAAAAYAMLLREHIQKENLVLFDLARQTLPAAVCERLLGEFERSDASLAARDWAEVARSLCERAGADYRGPGQAGGSPGFGV